MKDLLLVLFVWMLCLLFEKTNELSIIFTDIVQHNLTNMYFKCVQLLIIIIKLGIHFPFYYITIDVLLRFYSAYFHCMK